MKLAKQQIDRTIEELGRCLFLGSIEDDEKILEHIQHLEQLKSKL